MSFLVACIIQRQNVDQKKLKNALRYVHYDAMLRCHLEDVHKKVFEPAIQELEKIKRIVDERMKNEATKDDKQGYVFDYGYRKHEKLYRNSFDHMKKGLIVDTRSKYLVNCTAGEYFSSQVNIQSKIGRKRYQMYMDIINKADRLRDILIKGRYFSGIEKIEK